MAGVDAGCIRGRRRARFAIAARGRHGWRRTKGGIDEDDRNKPKKIVFVRRDVFSVFCRLCGKSREHQLKKKPPVCGWKKFSPRAFLLRKRGKTEEAMAESGLPPQLLRNLADRSFDKDVSRSIRTE